MADIMEYREYEKPLTLEQAIEIRNLSTAPPKPWEPEVGEIAFLMLPVKVMRDWGTKVVDVCDAYGNCLQVSKKALHKNFLNEETRMNLLKDCVLKIAQELAKANNTFTTLEIKLQGRRDYPFLYWTQQGVSDYMNQFAGDGIFTYTDNGTFRTYSLATPAQVAATAGPVSKTLVAIPGPVQNSAIVNPTQTVTAGRKRGRPKKSTTITRTQLPAMITNPGFESIQFGNSLVLRSAIRAQKKSPLGYLTQAKIAKATSITISGTTYQIV